MDWFGWMWMLQAVAGVAVVVDGLRIDRAAWQTSEQVRAVTLPVLLLVALIPVLGIAGPLYYVATVRPKVKRYA